MSMPRRIQKPGGGHFREKAAGASTGGGCHLKDGAWSIGGTGPVFAAQPFHVPKRRACFRINRGAQNCSRTALKMLTLLRCVARLPCGGAVGFLCPRCACVSHGEIRPTHHDQEICKPEAL